MKKLFLTLFMLFAFISTAHSASIRPIDLYQNGNNIEVTFHCIGDFTDQSLDELIYEGHSIGDIIRGSYFYQICVAPLVEDTPGDAADVLVYQTINKDEKVDMLGSEDGSTAYNGLNIIQTTTAECAKPNMYVKRSGEHYSHSWYIHDTVTLSIANLDDTTGEYTITMVFVK